MKTKSWQERFDEKFVGPTGLVEQDIDCPWEAEKIKSFIAQLLTEQKEEMKREVEGMKKRKFSNNAEAEIMKGGYYLAFHDVLKLME